MPFNNFYHMNNNNNNNNNNSIYNNSSNINMNKTNSYPIINNCKIKLLI
jgi:hypothetical protein